MIGTDPEVHEHLRQPCWNDPSAVKALVGELLVRGLRGQGRYTHPGLMQSAHARCMPQAIQRRRPRSHTIVEAHPDVHARMLQQGWDRKPGVRILFGRWQDVLPEAGLAFDGIFWDTFSEYYEDMQ